MALPLGYLPADVARQAGYTPVSSPGYQQAQAPAVAGPRTRPEAPRPPRPPAPQATTYEVQLGTDAYARRDRREDLGQIGGDVRTETRTSPAVVPQLLAPVQNFAPAPAPLAGAQPPRPSLLAVPDAYSAGTF